MTKGGVRTPRTPPLDPRLVWVLSEASTGYISKLQVYVGSENNARESGLVQRVLKDLTRGMDHKGYHIYTDNFYTSEAAADSLLARGLYLCGTVRKNSAGFPKKLHPSGKQERAAERGLYWWMTKGAKVAHMWYDNRPVYLLSTIHPPFLNEPDDLPTVKRHKKDGTVVEVKCPPALVDYTKNMGGVDRGDQLVMLYNSGRKSVKWWKRIVFYMVEVAALDAYIIECTIQKQYGIRKRSYLHFKMDLATRLIGGHSFRKRKGRPSIGDPVDDVRLQNVGLHMPVYTLSRRDCRVCNEKITRSGSACVTGAGPSRDGGKSYDTDRHRSHVFCNTCHVALCLNKDRNCYLIYHTYKDYWRH